MIIGETFNESNFNGQEEDHYDYLFKGGSKKGGGSPRGSDKRQNQNPGGNRQASKKFGKKFVQAIQAKKQSGLIGKLPILGRLPIVGKLPIVGNFGMFDKNKKKDKQNAEPYVPAMLDPKYALANEEAAAEQAASDALNAPAEEQQPLIIPENNTPKEVVEAPAPEIPEAPVPADPEEQTVTDIDSYDFFDEKDAKASVEAENKKKEPKTGGSSIIECFGWVCLGITAAIIIGVLVSHKTEEKLQPQFKTH